MFNSNQAAYFSTLETPFYYYDLDLLEKTLVAAKTAADSYDFDVHYALKANFNERLLTLIQEHGYGADCVSGNEVLKAVEVGFPAEKIVFAGVGKSDKEIKIALQENIFCFNVESVEELKVISDIASASDKVAQVALRINPNVDAQTHHYITTGLDENKFGIKVSELDDCLAVIQTHSAIELIGVHFHVGSQVTDMSVFKNLCVKANDLNDWFDERGYRLKVLNVGGGLGIDYQAPDQHPVPDFEAYFKTFDQFLNRKPGQEVHFELGRSLVAQSGSLVSRVLYVKEGIKKNFLILDAGMTELLRPALYQAYHKIERVEVGEHTDTLHYDVVGPICESSDSFGKEVELSLTQRNDLIVVRSAGAYGEAMSSRYNLRDEIRYVYSDQITK